MNCCDPDALAAEAEEIGEALALLLEELASGRRLTARLAEALLAEADSRLLIGERLADAYSGGCAHAAFTDLYAEEAGEGRVVLGVTVDLVLWTELGEELESGFTVEWVVDTRDWSVETEVDFDCP